MLGPWTWVASLLLPLFRGLKYPAVSSLFPRPSPRHVVDPTPTPPPPWESACIPLRLLAPHSLRVFVSFGELLGPVTFLNQVVCVFVIEL